jgi:hypothetical protein
MTAFMQGLQELGWIDGRNIRIDIRYSEGDADRARRYAAELVALAPDVMLVDGGSAPPSGRLCGPNTQGRKAGRLGGAGADQI